MDKDFFRAEGRPIRCSGFIVAEKAVFDEKARSWLTVCGETVLRHPSVEVVFTKGGAWFNRPCGPFRFRFGTGIG